MSPENKKNEMKGKGGPAIFLGGNSNPSTQVWSSPAHKYYTRHHGYAKALQAQPEYFLHIPKLPCVLQHHRMLIASRFVTSPLISGQPTMCIICSSQLPTPLFCCVFSHIPWLFVGLVYLCKGERKPQKQVFDHDCRLMYLVSLFHPTSRLPHSCI
jgi:hypothetical protein